jgi:4-amino-4-deoxy-L-arabinose transferase-like glycosyltransferase
VPGNSRLWLGLVLAGCVVAVGSAGLPFLHFDDPLYTLVAKNVVATGDWITLRHPAYAQVDKPPLTIWLMAASIWLAGDTPIARRAWHILMTLALVLTTYRVARRGAGPNESLLAALVLITATHVHYQHLAPQQDVPLTLFLVLAFLAFHDYRQFGRTRDALLAGVWVALGTLTKGLVAPAIFGLVAITDIVVCAGQRHAEHWNWGQVAAGAIVFVSIAAPWFVAGAQRGGEAFVDTLLLGRMGLARAIRPAYPTAPYLLTLLYYVPVLVAGVLPWTGALPGALRELGRGLSRSGPPSIRLCALWCAIPFLVLSILPTDHEIRYILPVYPALAVLIARTLTHAGAAADRGSGRSTTSALTPAAISIVMALVCLTIGVQLIIAQNRTASSSLPLVTPSVFVLCAGLVVGGLAWGWGRVQQTIAVFAVSALVANAAFIVMAARHWETLWPWPAVAAAIESKRQPGDRVFVVGELLGERHFAHYYFAAPVQWVDDDKALARVWGDGGAFALVAPHYAQGVRTRLRPVVLFSMPSGWILVTNK